MVPCEVQVDWSQFEDRTVEFLTLQRLAMPSVLILEERDTLPLDGAGDENRGAAAGVIDLAVGGLDRVDVVPVPEDDRVPAEGGEACLVRFQVPAQHGLAALAQPVDVQDAHQVVQLVV